MKKLVQNSDAVGGRQTRVPFRFAACLTRLTTPTPKKILAVRQSDSDFAIDRFVSNLFLLFDDHPPPSIRRHLEDLFELMEKVR